MGRRGRVRDGNYLCAQFPARRGTRGLSKRLAYCRVCRWNSRRSGQDLHHGQRGVCEENSRRPVDVEIGETYASAAHDGFRRLGIVHRRRYDFLDDRIEISDILDSRIPSTGIAHFHCHPDVEPSIKEEGIEIGRNRLILENAQNVEILPYEYCEGFNDRRPGKKIAVTFESTLKSCICYEDSLHNG